MKTDELSQQQMTIEGNVDTGGGLFNTGMIVTQGGDVAGGDIVYGDQNIYGSELEKAAFYELGLRDESERQVRANVIEDLRQILERQRVIVLGNHPHIHTQILAYQLARYMRCEGKIATIFQWPGDKKELELSRILSEQESLEMTEAGLYICLSVSAATLSDEPLFEVQRQLERCHQYMLLTVHPSVEEKSQAVTQRRFWADVPDDVYAPAYLSGELCRFLEQADISTANVATLTEDEEVAIQLRSPTNIDFFVTLLERQAQEYDPKHIKMLIETVRSQNITQKIHYLFEQLSEHHYQLLAVGLCLFGGLYEAQFFRAMRRVIHKHWQHMFQSLELFDYFHLASLRSLLTIQDGYINHQHPEQYHPLLEVAWRDYQYHIREAMPVLAEIVVDSVTPGIGQHEGFENYGWRSHLRTIIGQVISDIGQRSIYAVEDVVLRLASHHFSTRPTAVRIMSQWASPEQSREIAFYQMLIRWQKGKWRQADDYSVNEKNVLLTIAHTTNQILRDLQSESLHHGISELVYGMLFSPYEEIRAYIQQSIRPRLLPHVDPLLQDWSQRSPPENLSLSMWLRGIVPFMYECDQHGKLDDKSASWFIAGMKQTIHDGEDLSFTGTMLEQEHCFAGLEPEHKQWLVQQFLPRYLVDVAELLLFLARDQRAVLDVVYVFEHAFLAQQTAVDQALKEWRRQWQEALLRLNEARMELWWPVLPAIGLICEVIDQREHFEKWLVDWRQDGRGEFLACMAEALAELHRLQLNQPDVNAVDSDDITTQPLPTPIKEILYGWLCDSQAEVRAHQEVLLFWGEVARKGLAQQCVVQLSHQSARLLPYLVVPHSRSSRRIVQNLLPLGHIMRQIDSDAMSQVLVRWQNSPQAEIRQIANDLGWALWRPHLGFLPIILCGLMRSLWWLVKVLFGGLDRLRRYLWRIFDGSTQ